MGTIDTYKFDDIVFPIIKISIVESKAKFERYLGSGFFIGEKGHFLTAKHVFNDTKLSDLKSNERIAIQLHLDRFRIFPVDTIEEHPSSNVDLAIGLVKECPIKEPNFFQITEESRVFGWLDVHSYGFPNFLLKDIPKEGQFMKGYILRETQSGDSIGTISNAPSCYIVNFAIPNGMSGSPVFRTGPHHPLVGLCLGAHEISTTLWENTFVEDGVTKILEKKDRVIENGIVLKIIDYLDWKIKLADNQELKSLF